MLKAKTTDEWLCPSEPFSISFAFQMPSPPLHPGWQPIPSWQLAAFTPVLLTGWSSSISITQCEIFTAGTRFWACQGLLQLNLLLVPARTEPRANTVNTAVSYLSLAPVPSHLRALSGLLVKRVEIMNMGVVKYGPGSTKCSSFCSTNVSSTAVPGSTAAGW